MDILENVDKPSNFEVKDVYGAIQHHLDEILWPLEERQTIYFRIRFDCLSTSCTLDHAVVGMEVYNTFPFPVGSRYTILDYGFGLQDPTGNAITVSHNKESVLDEDLISVMEAELENNMQSFFQELESNNSLTFDIPDGRYKLSINSAGCPIRTREAWCVRIDNGINHRFEIDPTELEGN